MRAAARADVEVDGAGTQVVGEPKAMLSANVVASSVVLRRVLLVMGWPMRYR